MLERRRPGLPAWLALLAWAAIAGCTDGNSVVGGTSDASTDIGTDIGPRCAANESSCGGRCVDLQASRENCGTCGNACPGSQVCVAGSCQIGCPTGQQACGGACVTLSTDRANCGACGNTCGAGQVCAMGVCGLECGPMLALCGGASDAGASDAGTSARYCADTRTDRLNCGGCGTICPAGQVCNGGACEVSCLAGQTTCSGVCRDLQTDRAHCGACSNACAGPGQVACGVAEGYR